MTIRKLNRCDTMWHCDTFVTPNVFQFIELSNDGRSHCRGTYLLDITVESVTEIQIIRNSAYLVYMHMGVHVFLERPVEQLFFSCLL
jgi:hypothetical protein